jgi:hypothetical protein
LTKKLPSVTQALKPWSNFDFVKPEVLKQASEDGTAIHSLLFRHLKALMIFPEEITPEIEGYFTSGRRWADKHIMAVHLAEMELRDELRGYLGHPDLIVTLRGDQDKSLWDWKRAVPVPTHPIQIGGYYGLAQKNGHEVRRAGCVYLRPDGKMPNLSRGEFTSTVNHDYHVFLCCLTAYKYFQKGA